MSPTTKKRTAAEWRPTTLQLATLRELNFAAGTPLAMADLAGVLGTGQSPGASPTVKSLVLHGAVSVKGEQVFLTTLGANVVSRVCLQRAAHSPTKASPGRCADCGAPLAQSGDVGQLLARVREVRASLGEVGGALSSTATLARQVERQGDAALLAQASRELERATHTLDLVAELAERGGRGAAATASLDASLAVAVACSGPGALVGLVERDVVRLVESGWEVVAGPRPWRARHAPTGKVLEASSLGALVERVRGGKGGEA
ncbi:hypothetical protein ACN28S_23960 [Cystobacter fuscus]